MALGVVKPNLKLGIIVSVFTCIILGMFPAASRAAYAEGANVVFILYITTVARLLAFLGLCVKKRKPLFKSRVQTKLVALSAFWAALGGACMMSGLAYISGPLMLIILSTNTLFLFFFMVLKGEEQLNSFIILISLLIIAGLTLVVEPWQQLSIDSWIGIALAVTASFAIAFRVYTYSSCMKEGDPAVVGAEVSVLVLFLFLPLLLWQTPEMPQTLVGWGWTALNCVVVGTGGIGIMYGIFMTGAFRWSLFAHTQPIFTAIFSVWFMGEYLGLSQYIGMGIVIASLIAYQSITHWNEKKVAMSKEISKSIGG